MDEQKTMFIYKKAAKYVFYNTISCSKHKYQQDQGKQPNISQPGTNFEITHTTFFIRLKEFSTATEYNTSIGQVFRLSSFFLDTIFPPLMLPRNQEKKQNFNSYQHEKSYKLHYISLQTSIGDIIKSKSGGQNKRAARNKIPLPLSRDTVEFFRC